MSATQLHRVARGDSSRWAQSPITPFLTVTPGSTPEQEETGEKRERISYGIAVAAAETSRVLESRDINAIAS
jgi:hypothetical protein